MIQFDNRNQRQVKWIVLRHDSLLKRYYEKVGKLDSMRWFSQHRSPTPHFWGCTPRGSWPTNLNSAEIFVQCTYPQVSSSYVYSFGSYHVDKHANRFWRKHPTCFAMLWRWVKTLSALERLGFPHQKKTTHGNNSIAVTLQRHRPGRCKKCMMT